tara:strand:- start:1275 stop:1763 length:489 start_codon:yes stop_codon:yes gene_type:complete
MGATTLYNFKTKVLDHTPTINTAEYAQHDILFDFEAVTLGEGGSATRPISGTINNFILTDKDDEGVQITVFFTDSSSASLGSINAGITITDAHAAAINGYVDTGATYEDMIGCKIIRPSAFAPIPFVSTDDKIYVGGVMRGSSATTWTSASDITMRIGVTIE